MRSTTNSTALARTVVVEIGPPPAQVEFQPGRWARGSELKGQ
jgi:hypothetical protein